MKIFQVITVSEYGGAQTIVADLIKNLSPEHELFVLYGGEGEAWSGLGDNFTRIRLSGHRKSTSWKDAILFLKLVYYRIKYRPDVVHLHSSKMGILGRIAFNKKKTILTMHGFDSVRKAYPKFLLLEKKLSNRAYRIVAVSKYDERCLAEENITNNVVQVYNGVADHTQIEIAKENKIAQKLNEIKETYPHIIMCISRISKQKKFELFLEVANKMPEYAFVWIGNKEPVLDLPSNVYCLGEHPSAFIYLKYADIFTLPSNYEGLPISLLEALSFGVPIVASDVGGISEIVNDVNGFVIENDSTIFEEKIRYILSDKEIHQRMSKNARNTYLKTFSVQQMIDGYKMIFNEIEHNNK